MIVAAAAEVVMMDHFGLIAVVVGVVVLPKHPMATSIPASLLTMMLDQR